MAKQCYARGGHLRAQAAPPELHTAFLQAGFTDEVELPLNAQDKAGILKTSIPVLNLMDSDAAYFHD
jgi:hypothetical protein